MPTVAERIPPLVAGDRLTREEFLRRWEAMPRVKKAELIGGVVYIPSPVRLDHGESHSDIAAWLGVYAASTTGCRGGKNATWYMLKDAPQPDGHLRILPEYGGQSDIEDGYGQGAPELAAEISLSSTAYDLHQKMELYRKADVLEYVTVLVWEQEVRWHRLVNGVYEQMPLPTDGILRSGVFPGLWLNVPALLGGDMAQVLTTVQQGIQSPEHAAFVEELARKRAR